MPTESEDKEDKLAELRDLAFFVCHAAKAKHPWARFPLDTKPEHAHPNREFKCKILRRAAQVLSRRNEEVVALGLSGPKKPEEGASRAQYTVYARNSERDRSSPK